MLPSNKRETGARLSRNRFGGEDFDSNWASESNQPLRPALAPDYAPDYLARS